MADFAIHWLMSKKIYLPRFFTPRPYQLDIFKAFFKDGKKRFVNVWHRRAGKDQTWLHLTIMAAQLKVGTYLHTLPTIAQAKKVVWRNIDEQGHTLFDYIPKELLASTPNSTELFVKFKNGSILQFAGADNFDSLRGTNPVHITFSEYSYQHPIAWDILNPILVRNKGTAAFIFTPNGQNHAHTLYENNIDNPEFYVSNLTVNETRDNDGNYVVSPEDIQKMRDAGSSEEFIQREFYCSFNAFQGGNYFVAEYDTATREGRILDFPIDVGYPVNTYWDIGLDTTAIWLIQATPQGYKAIGYYEYNNVPYSHYINWLDDFRKSHGIVYGRHYAPHDARHREKFSGETYIERAAKLGINYEFVPRVAHKIDGIEAVRTVFNQVTFHKTLCKHGLLALQSYHSEYNERLKVFSRDPCHDWSSHGCLREGTKIKLKSCTKNIQDVVIGDIVDLDGIDGKVIDSAYIKITETLKITLSDGKILECTPEHKIFTTRGVVHADELRHNDILFTLEKPLCNLRYLEKRGVRDGFISFMCIIKTKINLIMIYRILRLSLHRLTPKCMQKIISGWEAKKTKVISLKQGKLQQNYARVANLEMGSMCKVYDLTIEKHHCYFANGILVSNSDAFMQFAQSYQNHSTANRVLYNRVNVKSLYN